MKAQHVLSLVLLLFCQTLLAIPYQGTPPTKKGSVAEQALSRKALEQQLNRKLTLKERVGFWLVKKKMKQPKTKDTRKTDVFAILGFLASLLFIPALLMESIALLVFAAILGLIFSIVGLVRIAKDPEKKKGKGWAIAGIALSPMNIMIAGLASLTSFFRGA